MLEYNSSDHITGGVFFQYNKKGLLRFCIYFSKKNSLAEYNYEIHDKELLAVIRYFKQ